MGLANKTCRCPADIPKWLKNEQGRFGHHLVMQLQAYEKDYPTCPLKAKCLRNADQKTPRQLNFKQGIIEQRQHGVIERMKQKISSLKGRSTYRKGLGIVEPVFGNIRVHKGHDRYSLRGQTKVNSQWQLYFARSRMRNL